ncbi:MAG TPA: EamA family transporter [Intrasporangium sp.]|uniref:EamA family transporter n=1 Tax=Intrasporangium sp. TaxID=1925024 RepID=UPI002D79DE9C|nr:EamA family transporter [Intrasporangium sp.]HET7399092.1 EamA family transporter [Intrasporangium sp.]
MAAGQAGRARVWFALGLVYLVWGSVYLAIRLVIDEAPALASMGVRFLLAGALMAGFLAVRSGVRRLRVTLHELAGMAFMGVTLLAIGNGMTSVGQLKGVPSGVAALLIAMVPLWIALFRTLSGDRPPLLSLLGAGVGLGGLAILVLRQGSSAGALPLAGVGVILVSSLSWSFGSWVQPRIWLPRDVFVSSTYQLLAAGVALFLAALLSGERFSADIGPRAWGALGYLVVVGSLVGFTAYAWLLQHAPISLIATHTYVNPVVAVLLGWLVLGEPVTSTLLLGGGVVIAAVVLVVSAERPARPRAEHVVEPGRVAPAADEPVGAVAGRRTRRK